MAAYNSRLPCLEIPDDPLISLGSADPFADLLLSAPIVLKLLLIGCVSESVRGSGGGPRPGCQDGEELV